jgi:tRNA threonylcarbamoyladenosine biosynthesis protein TsaE
MVEFFSRSPEQTRRVGMRLGNFLQAGDLICLQGELGAGKTTIVQGMAQGWGSTDAVSSPTFVLVNVYRKSEGTQLFHLDCYRIDSAHEAEELDFDTMLAQGPLVIEWPERVQSILPVECLWIKLVYMDDTQRAVHLKARGERYEELLANLRESAFGVTPGLPTNGSGGIGAS